MGSSPSARTSIAGSQATTARLLEAYRVMALSRGLDDVEVALKRQSEIYFQISGAGHEATLVAAARHLRPGHDWFFPYYRDRALCLGLGVSAEAMLLQAVGAASDPASGGRQMPSHWSDPVRHVVSEASTTGTQYLSAVGCAEAGLYWPGVPERQRAGVKFAADEVVYCSSGEGATSQGTFFEALNTACMHRLPVLFHVEDNGYAISTPTSEQTAGGSISKLVAGFPHLLRLEFDGCSVEASDLAWAQGVAYARARRGPVLLHAHVVRPYSHSLSDDERLYRSKAELRGQAERDPLPRLRHLLAERGQRRRVEALDAEVARELDHARTRALAAPRPKGASSAHFVYSPDVDPTGVAFEVVAAPAGESQTMLDLINATMAEEMARDARVLVFGQDVADVARAADSEAVLRGKGGVFKATHGLQRRFGDHRVFNAPLAEANIVGRAFGMALRGLKPVVEVQFFDYIWPAMMHLRSEVALLRWRSNNGWKSPLVVRAAYGGYLKGGSIFHSQTGETIFTHIPGLRVVLPSNAADAMGLLRTAIRCDDPVLFLEHKHLYRQPHSRSAHPGADYTLPFGQAARVHAGDHVTLVTYGATVKRSLDAAREAKKAFGIGVDVLDLRTLAPYDFAAVADSVRRTSRLLVVHEETLTHGFGAEVAARVADELFDCLDAPVRRLGAKDTFVGYHPNLEDYILPQTADILAAIRALAAY